MEEASNSTQTMSSSAAATGSSGTQGLARASQAHGLMAVNSTRRGGGIGPIGWSTHRALAVCVAVPASAGRADEATASLLREQSFATAPTRSPRSCAALARVVDHHSSAVEWAMGGARVRARVVRDDLLRRTGFPGADPGGPSAEAGGFCAVILHSTLPAPVDVRSKRPLGPPTEGAWVDYAGYVSRESSKNLQLTANPLPVDQALLQGGHAARQGPLPPASLGGTAMQFGRRGGNEFHLAVRAPMSALQAFGLAVMQLMR